MKSAMFTLIAWDIHEYEKCLTGTTKDTLQVTRWGEILPELELNYFCCHSIYLRDKKLGTFESA